MSEYKEKIVDAITGEVTWRDYSEVEVLQIEKNLEEIAKEQAEAETKAQAKATAEGKLAALGLTTDDLRALGL